MHFLFLNWLDFHFSPYFLFWRTPSILGTQYTNMVIKIILKMSHQQLIKFFLQKKKPINFFFNLSILTNLKKDKTKLKSKNYINLYLCSSLTEH